MIFDDAIADAILRGMVLSAVGLGWVILLVRIVGLRSFSKMTSVDFVMTVAVGSLLASAAQAAEWQALTQIMTVMAALFALQVIFAWLRGISPRVGSVIQNTPVLLMRDGKILEQRLTDHRVARADLMAKLREANVTNFSQVRAVVLETTGDVSVLHGAQLDEALLEGVRT